MPEALACVICHKTESETALQRCPMCFKSVCGEHTFHYSGRVFCGKHCADYFFFADPDE